MENITLQSWMQIFVLLTTKKLTQNNLFNFMTPYEQGTPSELTDTLDNVLFQQSLQADFLYHNADQALQKLQPLFRQQQETFWQKLPAPAGHGRYYHEYQKYCYLQYLKQQGHLTTKLAGEDQLYQQADRYLAQQLAYSEKDVQKFFLAHPTKLKPHAHIIKQEQVFPQGRADIIYQVPPQIYIAELKIVQDTDLVWQEQYYTHMVQQMYPHQPVRFEIYTNHAVPAAIADFLDPATQIFHYYPLLNAANQITDLIIKPQKKEN